jgi:hypothetical protein
MLVPTIQWLLVLQLDLAGSWDLTVDVARLLFEEPQPMQQ